MSADAWIQSLVLSQSGEHALTWSLMSIPFILFPIRLYIRYTHHHHHHHHHRLLSDDYLLFAAFLLMISLGAIHTYQYPILFQAHHYFTNPDKIKTSFPPESLMKEIQSLSKSQFAKIFIIWTLQWCCKLSLLMFLRRLLKEVNNTLVLILYMNWWWWGVVAMCTTVWVVGVLINCFTCFPPKRRWEGNSCNIPTTNNGLIAATILDITSDIGIILLFSNLFFSYRLKIKFRLCQKLIIAGVFGVSIIILIFLAIFRIILLYKSRETNSSIWLNGIAAAQFEQVFGTTAVVIAILPGLELFSMKQKSTQDMEGLQNTNGDSIHKSKPKGKAVDENGNTTVSLTTWAPEEGEHQQQEEDNTVCLGKFMRCESNHNIVAPFPEPEEYTPANDINNNGGQNIYAPSTNVPPIQVKLRQVIPDIGGETSPVIRKR
ncbi:hypothetical protein TWF225_011398 [Orbilia oligospora]|nr:hypothetical protein TWF225_011398 [Orbilia oligospora]KAF3235860.1 hypothetical protein TWF128_001698 [Orbilia oligospora]KAF3264721.1 hypothetical protein TWF217_002911 [Orbilia oligospora]KAF3281033.1 hypothetical protein TWF132_011347 [Orbilia oligospora]